MKDLHKKELQLVGDFRPAARYLYYKHVTMFLVNKFVENLECSKNAHFADQMWASPGPYLRNNYLTVLAQSIGYVFLPQVIHEMVGENSFEDSESAPK